MKTIVDFIESPLVIWTNSLLNHDNLDYEEFTNGNYLHLLLKQCDPRLQNIDLPNGIDSKCNSSINTRLVNIDYLLRTIRAFYQYQLNQILVYKPPDIYEIAKGYQTYETYRELEKMLVLILGIAIQGDYKEQFIDGIQRLDTNVQFQLITYIQLISTDDCQFAVSKVHVMNTRSQSPIDGACGSSSQSSSLSSSLITSQILTSQLMPTTTNSSCHTMTTGQTSQAKLMATIQRVCDERDAYAELIIELKQDKDYLIDKLNVIDADSHHHNDKAILDAGLIIGGTTEHTKLTGISHDISNKPDINASDQSHVHSDPNPIQMTNGHGINGGTIGTTSDSSNEQNSKHHLKISLQLVECKAKMRQLRMEIEEKSEQIEILREEIQECKVEVNKLRYQNQELTNRASLANIYCEEIETLREKSLKADKYEHEMNKYKDMLEPFDLFKQHLEEIKDENSVLLETRSYMEKQIDDYQARINALLKCEAEAIKYKQELNEIQKQNDIDKVRIRELIEVRTKHEFEIKSLITDNSNLNEELNYHKNKNKSGISLLQAHNQDVDNVQVQQQHTAKHLQFELDIKKLDNEIELLKQNEIKLMNALNEKDLNAKQMAYEYENRMMRLMAQLEAKEISCDENIEKIRCLTAEITDLAKYKTYTNNLESELNSLKDEIKLLNEKKLNVNQLNFDYEQKLKRLNAKLDAKDMSLTENIQKVKYLDAELKDMIKYKNNIGSLECELRDLKAKYADLEKDANDNSHALESQLRDLKAKYADLENAANGNSHALESQLRDLKAKYADLEKAASHNSHALELELDELKAKYVIEMGKTMQEKAKVQDLSISSAFVSAGSSNSNVEMNQLLTSHDTLNDKFNKLLNDHEHLQNLFFSMEYDCQDLLKQLNKKNLINMNLNQEIDYLKEEIAHLNVSKKNLSVNHSRPDSQTSQVKSRITIGSTDDEFKKLSDNYDLLNKNLIQVKNKLQMTEENLIRSNENLEKQALELHLLRQDNNFLKLENDKFLKDLNSKQDNFQLDEMRFFQLQEKCQALEISNEKLEDEKSQLYEQLHILVQQNHELLTQALASKDVYFEQNKMYTEQLNNLRRQKEALEQKIMEQYKRYPTHQEKKKRTGLMDIFSKKTQKIVGKVRTKSASGNSNSHSPKSDVSRQSPYNTNWNDSNDDFEPDFVYSPANPKINKTEGLTKNSEDIFDQDRLDTLGNKLAESALALRDISQNGHKYNSNENLYETSTSPSPSSFIASPTLQYKYPNEYADIDHESMHQEKFRSDFLIKRTESQYSTPRSLKSLKLARSASNCTPNSTPTKQQTNGYSHSTSPYSADLLLSNHQQPTNENPKSNEIISRQLRNSPNFKAHQSDLNITNESGLISGSSNSRFKNVPSSHEKKFNEFWLEYGCI